MLQRLVKQEYLLAQQAPDAIANGMLIVLLVSMHIVLLGWVLFIIVKILKGNVPKIPHVLFLSLLISSGILLIVAAINGFDLFRINFYAMIALGIIISLAGFIVTIFKTS